MSGRSGYRKTDRKRNRHAVSAAKPDYVLRFTLPRILSAFVAPGPAGWGVTVGYNDVVFVTGQSPQHCCDLAATFLSKVNAARLPLTFTASVIKLLPCSAHAFPARSNDGFKKVAFDVETVHDRVSRFADRSRAINIDLRAEQALFVGHGWAFRHQAEYRDVGKA